MTTVFRAETARGKAIYFWNKVKEEAKANPGQLFLAFTFNHPTIAYRTKRDIGNGTHYMFKNEQGKWRATVVKVETPIPGRISGKVTYPHELYLVYLGG